MKQRALPKPFFPALAAPPQTPLRINVNLVASIGRFSALCGAGNARPS